MPSIFSTITNTFVNYKGYCLPHYRFKDSNEMQNLVIMPSIFSTVANTFVNYMPLLNPIALESFTKWRICSWTNMIIKRSEIIQSISKSNYLGFINRYGINIMCNICSRILPIPSYFPLSRFIANLLHKSNMTGAISGARAAYSAG